MTAYILFSVRRDSFKEITFTTDRVEFVMDDAGLLLLQALVAVARDAIADVAAKVAA